MAQPGGVLTRAGHTEAGCDLARLAGLEPAAVIVEIMNDDGTMARRPQLEAFARQHGLKIGTIADLIRYRLRTERSVERIAEQRVATEFGEFPLLAYEDHVHRDVHLALVRGTVSPEGPAPLVRVHVADTLRDLLGVGDRAAGLDAARCAAAHRPRGPRRGGDPARDRVAAAAGRCGARARRRAACSRRRARAARCCAPTASARRSSRTSACAACACCRRRSSCTAFRPSTSKSRVRGPGLRCRAPSSIEGELDARGLQVAVVAARFNDFDIVEPAGGRLRALGCARRRPGGADHRPRARRFELPLGRASGSPPPAAMTPSSRWAA